MGKKVYAIKEGFDSKNNKKIENLIVNTWAECLALVKGVKGAKYKSFETIDLAKEYLNDDNKLLKKGIDRYKEECLHAYVDGSYNVSSERYSYGVVVVRDNVVEWVDSGSPADNSKSNIRQIAGELEGAVKAVEYALSIGEKELVLFHDYEGIFHHATGSWERKDKSSEEYYEKMNSLFNQGIVVTFVKVDSHTGDLYNELVDEKCKEALGITSDKVVEKWLGNNKLYVANNKIREEIIAIAANNEKNIVIKENEKHSKSNEVVENNKGKDNSILEELKEIVGKLSLDKQEELLKYAKYISKK